MLIIIPKPIHHIDFFNKYTCFTAYKSRRENVCIRILLFLPKIT